MPGPSQDKEPTATTALEVVPAEARPRETTPPAPGTSSKADFSDYMYDRAHLTEKQRTMLLEEQCDNYFRQHQYEFPAHLIANTKRRCTLQVLTKYSFLRYSMKTDAVVCIN